MVFTVDTRARFRIACGRVSVALAWLTRAQVQSTASSFVTVGALLTRQTLVADGTTALFNGLRTFLSRVVIDGIVDLCIDQLAARHRTGVCGAHKYGVQI
jgi:hypothetical protein